MHPDCLFAVQHSRLVAHHARFVECRLSVEDENIAVPKVSIHLLIDGRRGRVQAVALGGPMRAFLRRQQLIRDSSTLLQRELILNTSRI